MSIEKSGSGQDSGGTAEPPGLRKITDVRMLRALAHPLRIALLEELMLGGAMTATQLGERIGESPPACSFHLRQLAKYGFVEEAGRRQGRARPWRLTSIGMSFAPGGDLEAEIASTAALRLFRERQFARYQRWQQTRASYPTSWQQGATDYAYVFYLTAEELGQMNREVQDVLMRWFRSGRLEDPSSRPPGSAPVETLLLSYPTGAPQPVSAGQQPAAGDRP